MEDDNDLGQSDTEGLIESSLLGNSEGCTLKQLLGFSDCSGEGEDDVDSLSEGSDKGSGEGSGEGSDESPKEGCLDSWL